MKCNTLIFFLCLSLLAFNACKDAEKEEETETEATSTAASEEEGMESGSNATDSLILAVEGNPDLSTFAARLNIWEVDDTIASLRGPFTIFAPSNLAYSTFYQEQGQEVLDVNTDAVLSYHIVPEKMTAAQIRQELSQKDGKLALQTVNGELLAVGLENGTIVLTGGTGNKAEVTQSYTSGNGVIHVISGVLLPTEIETEVIIHADSID